MHPVSAGCGLHDLDAAGFPDDAVTETVIALSSYRLLLIRDLFPWLSGTSPELRMKAQRPGTVRRKMDKHRILRVACDDFTGVLHIANFAGDRALHRKRGRDGCRRQIKFPTVL